MRKIFVLALVCLSVSMLLLPRQSHAIPAFGQVYSLKQPDGSFVKARIWGDEYYQFVESMDGHTLIRDPRTQVICYATVSPDGNEFVSTGISASGPLPATAALSPHLRIKQASVNAKVKAARGQAAAESRAAKAQAGVSAAAPALGARSINGICLFIEFQDQTAAVGRPWVQDMLTTQGLRSRIYNTKNDGGLHDNYGSVYDYYYEVSDGNLFYYVDLAPTFTSAKDKAYYDDPSKNAGPQARALIKECLDWLTDLKQPHPPFNTGAGWMPYGNGSNWITALNVYYAGTVSSGWTMGLWPHQGYYNYALPGGYQTFVYQICDLGDTLAIGTFCHENGHMLFNWPDFYDYTYRSQGLGMFDLMAAGSYGGATGYEGCRPVPPNPYLKRLEYWASIPPDHRLVPGQRYENLVVPHRNEFYLYENPATQYLGMAGTASEYFLINNIEQYSTNPAQGWELYLPDSGLGIWHVEDQNGDNSNPEMTPSLHYLVSLEQADGFFNLERNANTGDSNDLFMYPNPFKFGPSTIPNSNWWSGEASGFGVRNYSGPGENMTIDVGLFDEMWLTPASGLSISGPEGGPFAPNSRTYTLKNKANYAYGWTATGPSWMIMSPASGSLSINQTATITAALNADLLPARAYTSQIAFKNLVSGQVLSFPVTLSVLPINAFAWQALPPSALEGAAFNAAVSAVDSEGVTAKNFHGMASLSAMAASGQTIRVEPSVIGPFVDGVWTGQLRALDPGATVRLTADDGWGHSGRSGAIDVTTASLAVTPDGEQDSSGNMGGPFSPASFMYRIKNNGTSTLNWQAFPFVAWLAFDKSSGSLEPGASELISAALTASANALPYGIHIGSVQFTDSDSGLSEQRPVQLFVVDWSKYVVQYKRDGKAVDFSEIKKPWGIGIVKGGVRDSLAIKKAAGVVDALTIIPLVKTDTGLIKLYTEAAIRDLNAPGELRSVTAKNCHVASLNAGQIGAVTMNTLTDVADSSHPAYALTSIVSTGAASKLKMSLRLTNVVLERLRTKQAVSAIAVSSKKFRDAMGFDHVGFGAVGPLGLVAPYAMAPGSSPRLFAGVKDLDPADPLVANPEGFFTAGAVGSLTVTGGPIAVGRIGADVARITSKGAVFTLKGGVKKPLSGAIELNKLRTRASSLSVSAVGGNIKVRDLWSLNQINSLSAKVLKYTDVDEAKNMGGILGFEDDANVGRYLFKMRINSQKGNIGTIYGSLGIYGAFVSSSLEDGTPACASSISRMGTLNPYGDMPFHTNEVGIFGEGYVSVPAVQKIAFTGDVDCSGVRFFVYSSAN